MLCKALDWMLLGVDENTSQQGFFAGFLPSKAQCGSPIHLGYSSHHNRTDHGPHSSQKLRGRTIKVYKLDKLKPQRGSCLETHPETLAAMTSLLTALCPVRTDTESVTLATLF